MPNDFKQLSGNLFPQNQWFITLSIWNKKCFSKFEKFTEKFRTFNVLNFSVNTYIQNMQCNMQESLPSFQCEELKCSGVILFRSGLVKLWLQIDTVLSSIWPLKVLEERPFWVGKFGHFFFLGCLDFSRDLYRCSKQSEDQWGSTWKSGTVFFWGGGFIFGPGMFLSFVWNPTDFFGFCFRPPCDHPITLHPKKPPAHFN